MEPVLLDLSVLCTDILPPPSAASARQAPTLYFNSPTPTLRSKKLEAMSKGRVRLSIFDKKSQDSKVLPFTHLGTDASRVWGVGDPAIMES